MIEVEMRTIAGNDVLHACPAGRATDSLPTVLFYHGFTSSNIVYSYFAVALAQAGFRVVMPDAADHGARFSGDAAQRMLCFWPILVQNFHEFLPLKQAIIDQGWVDEERLAVAGASMGAMTALGLMAHHSDVKCVASLMGSGYFSSLSRALFPSPECPEELDEWDVGKHLNHLADRPLLLWHGADDDLVPAAESFRLQQDLIQRGLDRQLTCRWQAGVRHRITPEAVNETVAFFRQHL